MLTAPFGGSGGRPIDTGLCVEEPDIEIGAGVSSKAISRRMQTDKGGSNGPKSTRHREDDPAAAAAAAPPPTTRWRRGRDDGQGQMELDNPPQNSSMADFPFGISTLPNGMPNFPSGFRFPDPGTAGRT
jgi:protein NRD1